jgi:hypothetical protein
VQEIAGESLAIYGYDLHQIRLQPGQTLSGLTEIILYKQGSAQILPHDYI